MGIQADKLQDEQDVARRLINALEKWYRHWESEDEIVAVRPGHVIHNLVIELEKLQLKRKTGSRGSRAGLPVEGRVIWMDFLRSCRIFSSRSIEWATLFTWWIESHYLDGKTMLEQKKIADAIRNDYLEDIDWRLSEIDKRLEVIEGILKSTP